VPQILILPLVCLKAWCAAAVHHVTRFQHFPVAPAIAMSLMRQIPDDRQHPSLQIVNLLTLAKICILHTKP
jgi:hypothetical protein